MNLTAPEIERAETQYLNEFRRIYETGTDLANERTGNICRTLINVDLTYDARTKHAPILTSRKYGCKTAIAEFLGYLRGYTSAAQFRALGSKSWDANANETPAWLSNPNRKGQDDIGRVYGAVAREWPVVNWQRDFGVPLGAPQVIDTVNLIKKVYDNLRAGKDDRGEIITFWNPGMFHMGALRPCMYEHQFSLLGDDLYLNSTQRSNDFPIGMAANMVQVWLFLRLMAQITNKNPMFAYHRSVNAHIYGNQLELATEHLTRPIFEEPTIIINPDIKTLEDLQTWVTLNDFIIDIPKSGPKIDYPFSV